MACLEVLLVGNRSANLSVAVHLHSYTGLIIKKLHTLLQSHDSSFDGHLIFTITRQCTSPQEFSPMPLSPSSSHTTPCSPTQEHFHPQVNAPCVPRGRKALHSQSRRKTSLWRAILHTEYRAEIYQELRFYIPIPGQPGGRVSCDDE